MTRRVFVDCETGSLDPAIPDTLWEIGMVVDADETGACGVWHWQIAPDVSVCDPRSLAYGRFDERLHPLLRDAPVGSAVLLAGPDRSLVMTAASVASTVQDLTVGAELVGVNVQFDAGFLGGFLRAHGLKPAWDYHLVELCSMARGWLYGRGLADGDLPVRSDDLSRLCGVEPPPPEERHGALADARWNARWWSALTGAEVAPCPSE